jgi:hypothetical protein
MLVCQATALAGQYRIYFVGSEARAIEATQGVRPAGYVGIPTNPANLGNLPAAQSMPRLFHGAGTPNQIVTFLHPYTNKAISIPLTLPVGRPRVDILSDRVVYNYGLFSYKVVVRFLPNGLVEVTYKG